MTAQPAIAPVHDLSPRVVSLAREIDRLPPGEYVIRLTKADVKAAPWQAEYYAQRAGKEYGTE